MTFPKFSLPCFQRMFVIYETKFLVNLKEWFDEFSTWFFYSYIDSVNCALRSDTLTSKCSMVAFLTGATFDFGISRLTNLLPSAFWDRPSLSRTVFLWKLCYMIFLQMIKNVGEWMHWTKTRFYPKLDRNYLT